MSSTEPPVQRRRVGCFVAIVVLALAIGLAIWGFELF
jgi:hypothetical protein